MLLLRLLVRNDSTAVITGWRRGRKQVKDSNYRGIYRPPPSNERCFTGACMGTSIAPFAGGAAFALLLHFSLCVRFGGFINSGSRIRILGKAMITIMSREEVEFGVRGKCV